VRVKIWLTLPPLRPEIVAPPKRNEGRREEVGTRTKPTLITLEVALDNTDTQLMPQLCITVQSFLGVYYFVKTFRYD
jgi:hypothetical protein